MKVKKIVIIQKALKILLIKYYVLYIRSVFLFDIIEIVLLIIK